MQQVSEITSKSRSYATKMVRISVESSEDMLEMKK